jgi:IS5 family transposase
MSGKLPEIRQGNLFRPMLKDFIDPQHKLVLPAGTADWSCFENGFKPYCSEPGAPGVPIRVMAGFPMLKHLCNLGDETLPERWEQDTYFQYFCGMTFFEHHFPFAPSDFSHFRKRAGEESMGKIFACSVHLHGIEEEKKGKFVVSDTTVQENFTAFPTDAGLCKKVTDKCNKTAEREGIRQRQKFTKKSYY